MSFPDIDREQYRFLGIFKSLGFRVRGRFRVTRNLRWLAEVLQTKDGWILDTAAKSDIFKCGRRSQDLYRGTLKEMGAKQFEVVGVSLRHILERNIVSIHPSLFIFPDLFLDRQTIVSMFCSNVPAMYKYSQTCERKRSSRLGGEVNSFQEGADLSCSCLHSQILDFDHMEG